MVSESTVNGATNIRVETKQLKVSSVRIFYAPALKQYYVQSRIYFCFEHFMNLIIAIDKQYVTLYYNFEFLL